ncbi:glycosyltransferase involved in cell wall biosynthesis [Geodermatophilus tzadiensis]|uniref:Glycosyltransferase involved in cell wall biosynthesis n=1 Tax=Geodermatophilus tzadiensis TaxID=1137988 RepID=A0A2T0TR36_9ACTN|nr:glycosyltransferase [Geodermatophilus tzadiensis]PRY48136.1 glycosyltransferase involved in cell wall biosynthesis [Geodermatophilus tzadiensis]
MPGHGDAPILRAAYRLCVVTDAQEVGGAERFLTNLLTALPTDRDVTVLGTSPAVLARLADATPALRTAVVDDSTGAFRRALRRLAPDVVHLNLIAFPSCRRAAVAALSLRLPVVLVDHLPTPGLTWRGRAVQRLLTRCSAARIAVGRTAARDVERYGGLRAGSVQIIPNGVPDPGCGGGGPLGSRLVLGTLGRLERQKGLDVLLRALTDVPDADLVIAGDGSQRAALEDLAAEVGVVGRVRFLGPVDSPCVVLGSVHALVQPSRWEAMPLAVLEAMHSGRPVIATDVGDMGHVVQDGRTGFVVDPEDATQLAAACRRLIDPAVRERLGRDARVRARRSFSVAAMAASYDAAYRRAAAHPAGRRRHRGDRTADGP